MSEAKRRINKFKFDTEDAHVALVDKAANAQEVLVMKSQKASEEEIQKAVKVNLRVNLLEFLTRYLGLWIDDAEIVAGMLGMQYDDLYEEDGVNSFEEMVQRNLEKVEIQKSETATKLSEAFSEYVNKFSKKNSQPSVDSQGENVVKTEGKETNTIKPEEEVNKMTEENKVTDASVQEMIKKALDEQRKEVEEELRKSLSEEFESKDKERAAELEILKAKEDAREEKAFIAKAAEFKEHVVTGDSEQHEAVSALAKALRKAEADEDMKPLVELAKSLKETVEKSALLDEMGGTSIEKADEKYDTEGDKMVMKMVKDEGMKESDAYAKLMTERPELFQ